MDSKLMNIVFGMMKSWTVFLGGMIATMPSWWPLIEDKVAGLIGGVAYDKLVQLMGILVILVRFKTDKSLEEKGKS